VKNDWDYGNKPSNTPNDDFFGNVPRWLEQAIEQKNPRLTIALADSVLLMYDDWDYKLLVMSNLN
jgi:hypothetical protein